MIDDIIQEATEAEEQGRDAGYAVGELLRIINQQKAEKERLEYVLMAVMHSVDKWLEGDELKQDEANRACTMREKTLKITEKLNKKIDGLKKANQESWVAIEKKKAEIVRLQKENKEQKLILEAINDEMNPLPFETDFDKAMKNAKSEAYREFAESVKQISKEVTVSYIADTSIHEHKTGMFHYGKEDFDNALNKLLSNDMGRYDHYTDSFVKETAESNE